MRFSRPARGLAFTLLEVLLAIVIVLGLLGVAFYLYQQASELRTQLLKESEQTSVIRLVLERMTADLRAARADDWQGFAGTSNSIQFVKLGAPVLAITDTNALHAPTDSKLITYELASSVDGTNMVAAGLNRREEPLGGTVIAATNELSFSFNGAMLSEAVTNSVEPMTDVVRTLGFRYWDGRAWVENWSNTVPPKGIEITISPESSDGLEEPIEIYRRIVCIPAGVVSEKAEPSAAEFATAP